MSRNSTTFNHVLSRSPSRTNNGKTWKTLVEEQIRNGTLKGVTCCIHSTRFHSTNDETRPCVCGRMPRRHSFKEFHSELGFHVTEAPLSVYGELKNDGHFIRCDMRGRHVMKTLCQLIVDNVGAAGKPDLLMCCYGGAVYFTMNDNLEKEFMNGIAQVATTERVWVLTSGLSKGVSNVVGQSLHRHLLLNKKASKPTVIGLTGWGTVTERTRQVLKYQASHNPVNVTLSSIGGRKPMTTLSETEGRTLDRYHTHFLLLDDGSLNFHLDDNPRSDFVKHACEITGCYTITIIVDGGFHTLKVILNDLQANRLVIIIQGSGRLANILGTLLENTSDNEIPEAAEVMCQIKKYSTLDPLRYNEQETIRSILEIFNPVYRQHLKVFQLDGHVSLTDTIFQAVLERPIVNDESLKRLLGLAVSWNCIDGAYTILKADNNERRLYPSLFEQALKQNRPTFVDYFLRRYYDPLQTTEFVEYNRTCQNTNSRTAPITENTDRIEMQDRNSQRNPSNEESKADKMCVRYALKFIVENLYKKNTIIPAEKSTVPKTLDELDRHYTKLIGMYAESFYFERGTYERLKRDLKLDLWRRASKVSPLIRADNTEVLIDEPCSEYKITKMFKKQEMLRDLFLWSVYVGYADIAFVLLLQLKSRIGAALLATNMARRLSLLTDNLDVRHKYKEQAEAYEMYASTCIEVCHRFNERLACQLLVRELPLFGNITCMQIAIASQIQSFINTHTFNQLLNRQWHGQLDVNTTKSWWAKCKFLMVLLSFGLTASFLDYQPADIVDKPIHQHENDGDDASKNKPDRRARWKGIRKKSIEEAKCFQKIMIFHRSPIVKMFYHFLIYIWFLLVFSYMMLFDMRFKDNSIRWREIYVFITVTAMLIEDIRRLAVEYHTQMLERWSSRNIRIAGLYAIPYILFYIGFGLHMNTKGRADFFTAARIVLAIDLEIWYLLSLRFVSAIKLLGPKLFMIRNMMRDLIGFIYLIFICIAAYGVVSRVLFKQNELQFTAQNIFESVFYRPYWFLYSIVDDEKRDLDSIITSNLSTINQVREAKVTHVLLTFHMLFINILLLNLLIAVFNFSIKAIEGKNEYYWRYQRYELIKEYFQKPMFAFPPLSLLVYICLLIQIYVFQGTSCRIFKRLAPPDLNDYWTDFENAATYEHARTLVEKNYRHHGNTENSKILIETETETEVPTDTPIQNSDNELTNNNLMPPEDLYGNDHEQINI